MTPGRPAPGSPGADGRTLYVWRHPKAQGAEGRCIGHTDLAVDRRKAKRLAHRIRAHARRHGLPHQVATSPLRRCADVGRVLAGWGWRHRIDPLLIEADFGRWDGRAWSEVPRVEIDAWCADLLRHRPGQGEPVAQLLARVQAWRGQGACIAVGHGGWISAALWLGAGRQLATTAAIAPADWPAAPAHARCTRVCLPAGHRG